MHSENPLETICRHSRLRSRNVNLEGEWWNQDIGPLLCFSEEDGRPFALIPKSANKFEIINPADNTKRIVTKKNAAELDTIAYTFYRPLPDRALKAIDLFVFSLRDRGSNLAVVLAMGLLGGILGLVTPIATGMIMDDIIPSADKRQMYEIAAGMFVILVSVSFFGFIRSIAILRIEGRISNDTQSTIWDRILTLPSPFFRQFSTGDLAMHAGGINAIREMLSGAALTTIMSSLFSVFHFGLLFYYSMKLAFVGLAITLVTLSITLASGFIQLNYSRQQYAIQGKLSGLVFQWILGNNKLRVAGA